MKLRTEIQIESLSNKMNLFDGMLFLGSCFSDHVGGRFQSLGIPSEVNPFGVIFHPFPLLDILDKAIDWETQYTEADLTVHKGKFYSLAHHGSFSGEDKTEVLELMNAALDRLREALTSSKLICLTLGTAWGYAYQNRVVANCHKLPQMMFVKSLSSVNELKERLQKSVIALQRELPSAQTFLTVSPVRHVKDGIVGNSRSKSHLISAIHDVCDHTNAVYFPSYEMVVDDLRDYRFYKEDLIHPSDLAVDYIQEKFIQFGFSETVSDTISELKKFWLLKNHRVMSNNETVRREHEQRVSEKYDELKKKYPQIKI